MNAPWWWLSFCDGSRPKGQQFLGVVLVRAPDIVSACNLARAMGINPGGEVMGIEAPSDFVMPAGLAGYTGRLLTKAEAQELDRLVGAQRTRVRA